MAAPSKQDQLQDETKRLSLEMRELAATADAEAQLAADLPRDDLLRSRSAGKALLQRCDNALDRAKLGADGVELPITVNKAIGPWIGERSAVRDVANAAGRASDELLGRNVSLSCRR